MADAEFLGVEISSRSAQVPTPRCKERAPLGALSSNRLSHLGRLREPFAQRPKLAYLRRRQLMVALRQVIHRVVEPILLVFRRRANYAAAHDLLEQLVPGLRKRSRRSDWLLPESVFLSVHQFGWSENVYETVLSKSTVLRHHLIEERFMPQRVS